jgi:integrase
VGTIRKRAEGVFEVRAYIGRDPVTGQPRQVSRTVRGGIRAARAKLAELETEAAQGKLDGTDATVADLLTAHFEALERRGHSPQTLHAYRRYAKLHLVPAFGKRPVRKLTAWDLDRLYQAMQEPVIDKAGQTIKQGSGTSTVRQAHAIMSGALGQAVNWGWVPTNVGRSASPPAVQGRRVSVPTTAQVRAILAAAEERDPILARMVMLAALTGARRGEICALRWCDVNTKAGTLTIAHSILDLPGRVEMKDTKSHAVRVLALDPAATALLDLHRSEVELLASAADTVVESDGFVFSTDSLDGTAVVRPDRLTGFFNRVRDGLGAGYEGLTLHGLRHFVATQLAARGDVSARTLAGRLGHADASVTMRVYAEFFPAADMQAAEHMGRILTE